MKRWIWLLILLLISLGMAAFGQDAPRHSTKADTVLRSNPGAALPESVRSTWRTILGVVATQSLLDHEADNSTHGCSVVASETTVTNHTNATTNIHGSGADTRFLTASETILDAQIPAAIARDVEIPGNASFTLGGLLTKAFSELTDIPTTIAGYGLTDAASTTLVTDHIASTGTAVHGLGTAAVKNTGTSGDAVPLLDNLTSAFSGSISVATTTAPAFAVDIASDGTCVLRLKSLGNTNTVKTVLDRASTSAEIGTSFRTAGVAYAEFGSDNDSTNFLHWGSSGFSTKWMTLDTTSGRLGINTTTPAAPLHVVGASTLGGNVTVGTRDDNHKLFLSRYSSSSPACYFTAGDADRDAPESIWLQTRSSAGALQNTAIFDGNTNSVGIGTTTPQTPLHVVGDARVDGNLTNRVNSTTGAGFFTAYASLASGSHVALETYFPTLVSQRGRLTILQGNAVITTACFCVQGTANAVTLIDGSASVWTTATGTANRINIIADGDGTYTIQNLYTSTCIFTLSYLGY